MGCARVGIGQNACHCNIEYGLFISQLDVYILLPSKVYNRKWLHVYVRRDIPRTCHQVQPPVVVSMWQRLCSCIVNVCGDARDALVSGTTADNKHDRIS